MTDRRKFIKQSCAACAGVFAIGLLAELESCKTIENTGVSVSKNQVDVPLKELEGKNIFVIKNASLDYNIALVKKPDGNYLALQMICPHRDNPVEVSSTGFNCPSHGSDFDADGNVTRGPAASPLKKFPVTVEKDQILISLTTQTNE